MRSSSDSCGPRRTPREQIDRPQTDWAKCDRGHCPPGLYVVGIGPGDPAHLSQRAREVLLGAQVIVGYRTYIDLIAPMIAGKEIVRTGNDPRGGPRVGRRRSGAPGKDCRPWSPAAIQASMAMAGLVF